MSTTKKKPTIVANAGYALSKNIQLAIDKVLLENPEYYTKDGAKGMCVTASDKLMFAYDDIVGFPAEAYLFGDSSIPHYWAVIEGFCIDLTARQFDENEECPKIWQA